MRLRCVSLVLCSFLNPLASQSQDSSPVTDKHYVPIKDVVRVVETSLDAVKAQLQDTDPQLKSAEFDFQTVVTKDASGGLFASILTVQAEHKSIVTRETDFTYSVPDKQTALMKLQRLKSHNFDLKMETNCTDDVVSMVTCAWNKITHLGQPTDPETLTKNLPGAIVAATLAARDVSRVRNSTGHDLKHREFSIILAYQVDNSVSGGVDPSSLIPVGPQVKYSDETDRTQTLKLTFEDKQ
jgi:hypothetical protein